LLYPVETLAIHVYSEWHKIEAFSL